MPTASLKPGVVPSLFLFHGGGPLPVLGDPAHALLVQKWREHVATYLSGEGRPKAIVLVSAHFETPVVTVGAAAQPAMIYDYGGFPAESYQLRYPATGDPKLARRIADLIGGAGVRCAVDERRGLDHGVFVPLMLMFPEADIPVVPLSVLRSQQANDHIAIGRALAPLRHEGVLILGSGASSHNFHSRARRSGTQFNEHLSAIVTDTTLAATERAALLEGYLRFPGASEAQVEGEAEHLMPLFTALGAAGGNEAGLEVAAMDFESGPFSWNERHFLFP